MAKGGGGKEEEKERGRGGGEVRGGTEGEGREGERKRVQRKVREGWGRVEWEGWIGGERYEYTSCAEKDSSAHKQNTKMTIPSTYDIARASVRLHDTLDGES